jgi:hypothetical protein
MCGGLFVLFEKRFHLINSPASSTSAATVPELQLGQSATLKQIARPA